MTSTSHPPAETTSRSTITIRLAAAAILLAVPLLAYGTYAWVATVNSTSEDPLVGLGYVLAVFFGAPGLLAILFAGLGLMLRRRRPTAGVALAALGLGFAALPLALLVSWFVPLPMF